MEREMTMKRSNENSLHVADKAETSQVKPSTSNLAYFLRRVFGLYTARSPPLLSLISPSAPSRAPDD